MEIVNTGHLDLYGL